jgi:hypothetical protein
MTFDRAPQDFSLRRDEITKPGGLNDRTAGQAVIEKLLGDREGEPSRSFLGRVFGADPLSPDNYSWYKGALGEIVGRVLQRLGPEWTVLHAVPVGTATSDIDHVLIGPAGVSRARKPWPAQRQNTAPLTIIRLSPTHLPAPPAMNG